MKRISIGTRIGLVLLAALLALPLAPTTSPVAAKNRSRTITRTFSDPESLEVLATGDNSPLSASAGYPEEISFSGLKGKVRDVNLTLNDFIHSHPDEIEVLLVGPDGQTAIVMADAGGLAEAEDATLRLDDEAARVLTIPLQTGSFRPLNVGGTAIAFNALAPPVTSANAALSVFDGTDPNGRWRLFVQDDFGPTGICYFEGGWELEITTRVKANKKKR